MAQLKDLLVTGPSRFLNKIYGDLSGNADTAIKLATARKIGNASFDGSADIKYTSITPNMGAATASAAGTSGLVPAPGAGK